jgi:hypothetical protein
MKNNVKYYQVAGITVQVNSDFPISENTFHPKFKLFEVNGPGKDNVIVNHHFYLPDLAKNTGLLENGIYNKDQWNIYKTQDIWLYKYHPVFPDDPEHSAMGLFNRNHTHVDIYTDDINEGQYQKGRFSALTLFNTDQILFAKILCDRNGLIIHSNGFDIFGNGILLSGESGSGKSTLSAMLKKQGFQILCDDRMFIIHEENSYMAYGNWCHGTVPEVSQTSVPLRAIFFLEKSDKNSITLIENKKQIAKHLIQSMVKPFLNPQDWDKTFTMIENMTKDINCYILKFDLSGKICDKIKNLVKN